MGKQLPRIVIEKHVWVVEGNRKDNGNHLYYHVWAETVEKAQEFLKKHSELLKDIEVTFTRAGILGNGVYDMTANAKVYHPEKFTKYWAMFQGE